MLHKKLISKDKFDKFIKYKRSLSHYDFSLYHLNGNEKGLKHSLEILKNNDYDEIMTFVKTLDMNYYKVEILYTRLAKPGSPSIAVYYYPLEWLSVSKEELKNS